VSIRDRVNGVGKSLTSRPEIYDFLVDWAGNGEQFQTNGERCTSQTPWTRLAGLARRAGKQKEDPPIGDAARKKRRATLLPTPYNGLSSRLDGRSKNVAATRSADDSTA
jgi:hypothetical protein